MDWGRKWLVDFNAEKIQLVSFDQSNNTGAIDVKMDGSVLEENHLLRCWGWLSPLIWIGALTLSLLLKLPPTKLEPWFVLWSFFILRLIYISFKFAIRPCIWYCCYLWAVASGCYLGILDKLQKQICRTASPSLHFLYFTSLPVLPLLNAWLIVEIKPAKVFSIGGYYFRRCSFELA